MRVVPLLTLLLYFQVPELHGGSLTAIQNATCAINSVVRDIFVGLPGREDLVNAILEIDRKLLKIEREVNVSLQMETEKEELPDHFTHS